MPNWLISILDHLFSPQPKDQLMPAQPICTPDPAVVLACKIAQHYEGFASEPYLDPEGIPTIGWGSTYYEDGAKVTMADPGITVERAKILLYGRMEGFVNIVDQYVDAPLDTNQTAALADLVYNIGPMAFEDSTLLKLVNQNKMTEAAEQFLLWDHADGQVLTGLENRRKTEQELFLSGSLTFYN